MGDPAYLEVSLERGEESAVVFRFDVKFGEFLHLIFQIGNEGGIGRLNHFHVLRHGFRVQLLDQRATGKGFDNEH